MEVPHLERYPPTDRFRRDRDRDLPRPPRRPWRNDDVVPSQMPKLITVQDPRGFEYFDQLPQEIRLTVFDYISFCDWVLRLAPVCSAWRKLVIQCNRQKILSTEDFYQLGYGLIPFAALLEIVKNYQVYGLVLSTNPSIDQLQMPELLAASKQLTWVSIPTYSKSFEIYTFTSLTNTVSSVSFDTWNDHQKFKNLFGNIKELKICGLFLPALLENLTHPHLQTLHTIVSSNDDALALINNIRSVAPKLEVLYLLVKGSYEKSSAPASGKGLVEYDSIVAPLEKLEKVAANLGIKLYCRDLFGLLQKNPNMVIESFEHQGLPYSMYVKAYTNSSMAPQVVKFLLEKGHTTIERETRPQKLPNMVNRFPQESKINSWGTFDPFLFSREWILNDDSKAMIDFLLRAGYNVHTSQRNISLFDILRADVIEYILENTAIDLGHVTADTGDTIMHSLTAKSLILRAAMKTVKKMTKEQIVDIFSVKNVNGDTPLHCAVLSSAEEVKFLLELDLGAVWAVPNAKNETPLSRILTANKNSAETMNDILATVPVIPPGLVSAIFSHVRDPVEELLRSIEILRKKGGNFNEIVNGDPAVSKLPLTTPVLRALAPLGVDFKVTDSKNENLLYPALTIAPTAAPPPPVPSREFRANQPWDDDANLTPACEVLEILVKEFHLDVNHTSSSGITPLMHALQLKRSIDVIEKLLQLGANPNAGRSLESPLESAFLYTSQRTEALTALLKAGADPNLKFYNEQNTKLVIPWVSILNKTLDYGGDRALLELFVAHGADLHVRDDLGNTLLHLLKNDAHIDYVLKIIDVHETNICGQTPLWNESLSAESLQAMLKIDPNLVNHVANDGSTILFTRNEKIVCSLLEHSDKVDIAVLNKRGQSFMHTNLNHGPKLFPYLSEVYARQSEESKAQIRHAFNHVDVFGRTVLHYVCDYKDLSFLKNMVETFALDLNPTARAMNLQMAWPHEVIEFLLSQGSDPNAQSVLTGDTLLHFVCGDPAKADLVRLLLKSGASMDVNNSSGISPLDLDPNLKTGYEFAIFANTVATDNSAWRRRPTGDPPADRDDWYPD